MGIDELTLKALGKINLGLDVEKKLENGYHQVSMVMQTVNLYDTVTLKRTKETGLSLTCNWSFVPTTEDNLCIRAAKLLWEEFQLPGGLEIDLVKRIPMAAGMAGGSSDAAACLYGINQMYELGLTQKMLAQRGVTLGADIPYCLMRGTVLAEGIGEILTPIAPMVKCPVLIAKPYANVSTAQVYRDFDALESCNHPDIKGLVQAVEEQDLHKISKKMGNVLEEVTIPKHPQIQQIKDIMLEQKAVGAMMSGSGPTVFGLYETKEQVELAKEALLKTDLVQRVYATTIYNNRRK